MQLENQNRFQACQDQIEIRNLKQGYLILNEYQFWKIQVNKIMISIKEPNKRQIEKLENHTTTTSPSTTIYYNTTTTTIII